MRASSCFLTLFLYFLTLQNLSLVATNNHTLVQPLCHDEERSILIHFKKSFLIDRSVLCSPGAYSKLDHWKLEGEKGNCCSWDGVECNQESGNVISLDLSNSCLFGPINSDSSLFHLVQLQSLDLSGNNFNYSQIPSALGQLSSLRYLNLSSSFFSGQIPFEVSQLSQLSVLDLSFNYDMYGNRLLHLKNPNLESLVQNFTCLEHLWLSGVDISSYLPESLANISSLKTISMLECGLQGNFPSKIFHMKHLQELFLMSNHDLFGSLPEFNSSSSLEFLVLRGTQFSGHLPSSIGNLSSLIALGLQDCKFLGPIPPSIGNPPKLSALTLGGNGFTGMVDIEIFLMLKDLFIFSLSGDNLTVLTKNTYSNNTVPKLKVLALKSCNLLEFPQFLKHQNKLQVLDLSGNNIHGLIPKWMFNTGIQTLLSLRLDDNFLTGFDISNQTCLPWVSLKSLLLSANMLGGPLSFLDTVSNLSSLEILDFSYNSIAGVLPEILGNFSSYLTVLNIGDNLFHGTIPDFFAKQSKLKLIGFSRNKLQGQLPQSLVNCSMLEILDVSENHLNDVFPSWLGTLQELKVLILRSNHLFGVIGEPKEKSQFPKLRIIDLSDNHFAGNLPSAYMENWTGMKAINFSRSTYMQANSSFPLRERSGWLTRYFYKIRLSNKGITIEFSKLPDILAIVDLSGNSFEGELPASIGSLDGLYSLNLSNNFLTGHIPSSLVNMRQLESLDLSHNHISGEIPQQLLQLTFLEYFSISHNNLTGQIPQGGQLQSFPISSYEGNSGLCGKPLLKECDSSKALQPPPLTIEKEGGSVFDFGWKVVAIGYGFGVVVGFILGNFIISRKQVWLLRTLRIGQPARRWIGR